MACGADRVEHEVGRLGRERLLLGAVGQVGAERGGALAPLRLRLEQRDLVDAGEQRRLQRDEPDRPAAQHHRALHRLARQPEAHRVHAVGERLDERAGAGGDAVGQHARVGGRHAHELGERAGRVDADQHAVGAQVGVAGAAQAALAAAAERVDRDARAVELLRARAGRDDHARELVAHHQRRRAVAHVAEVALDLRAADPDRLRPQDQLAGPGVGRLRLLLDRHPLRALPHDRSHGERLPGQREGKCGGRGEVDRRLDRLPRAHVVDEAAAVAGEGAVAAACGSRGPRRRTRRGRRRTASGRWGR